MVKLAIMLVAPALTILSYVAQTHKIIRTRDTSALSRNMYILTTVAFAMWVVYGVSTREWPLIIPNAVCTVLAAVILALKLRASGSPSAS